MEQDELYRLQHCQALAALQILSPGVAFVPNLLYPRKLCLWGYTVFTLVVLPSIHPSVCDVLVFPKYFEQAMMEFHQTLQAH